MGPGPFNICSIASWACSVPEEQEQRWEIQGWISEAQVEVAVEGFWERSKDGSLTKDNEGMVEDE
ncbi:hypothetical protein HPP92_026272 [Vanilla planifolia]|uniref:Uncharacterized protein n=1 Tax=Vanilla planifolia TaxID=51239 RepID=A0A835PEX6_VANPL|nr:hypothetical protein HPP92_026272 [Vanilla planifolia]